MSGTVRLKVLRVSNEGPAGMPSLLLQEEDGRRCLSLAVGLAEALALNSGLGEVQLTRPLPHDLLAGVLRIGGLQLESVEILGPGPGGGGYEAALCLRDTAGLLHRQDARPADAVALALRAGAPVLIAEEALMASRWVESPRAPVSLEEGAILPTAELRRPCAPRPSLAGFSPRRPKWRM